VHLNPVSTYFACTHEPTAENLVRFDAETVPGKAILVTGARNEAYWSPNQIVGPHSFTNPEADPPSVDRTVPHRAINNPKVDATSRLPSSPVRTRDSLSNGRVSDLGVMVVSSTSSADGASSLVHDAPGVSKATNDVSTAGPSPLAQPGT
jgi:hypothetical protein